MQEREAAAVWRLAGSVVCEVASTVEGVHLGVLDRVRRATRSPAVDVVEQGATGVYRLIRGITGGVSEVGAATTAVLAPHGEPLGSSPRAAAVLAAVQAAIGDQLHDDPRTAPLSTRMTFRENGRVVAPGDIAADRLAVFVHGLAGTEHQWSGSYAQRLAGHGTAAAFVRYNTGRPIHGNGADLAALLDVVPGAPRLMLIGHSMGGLVIRSALAQAPGRLTGSVSDVVTLGTPHTGAPLEQVAAVALSGLARFRESSPIAAFGDKRAQGIKDLRSGALLPQDRDAQWPAGVRHTAVVATLGKPHGVLGWAFGDGLVRRPSAAHGGSRIHHLHGTGHMRLLDDPRVAEILAEIAAA